MRACMTCWQSSRTFANGADCITASRRRCARPRPRARRRGRSVGERAVASLGLPVFRMPGGAGHDAMKLHEVMPQATLFMRGLNAGISHSPLEAITNDDTELCVRAFQALLDGLAAESR